MATDVERHGVPRIPFVDATGKQPYIDEAYVVSPNGTGPRVRVEEFEAGVSIVGLTITSNPSVTSDYTALPFTYHHNGSRATLVFGTEFAVVLPTYVHGDAPAYPCYFCGDTINVLKGFHYLNNELSEIDSKRAAWLASVIQKHSFCMSCSSAYFPVIATGSTTPVRLVQNMAGVDPPTQPVITRHSRRRMALRSGIDVDAGYFARLHWRITAEFAIERAPGEDDGGSEDDERVDDSIRVTTGAQWSYMMFAAAGPSASNLCFSVLEPHFRMPGNSRSTANRQEGSRLWHLPNKLFGVTLLPPTQGSINMPRSTVRPRICLVVPEGYTISQFRLLGARDAAILIRYSVLFSTTGVVEGYRGNTHLYTNLPLGPGFSRRLHDLAGIYSQDATREWYASNFNLGGMVAKPDLARCLTCYRIARGDTGRACEEYECEFEGRLPIHREYGWESSGMDALNRAIGSYSGDGIKFFTKGAAFPGIYDELRRGGIPFELTAMFMSEEKYDNIEVLALRTNTRCDGGPAGYRCTNQPDCVMVYPEASPTTEERRRKVCERCFVDIALCASASNQRFRKLQNDDKTLVSTASQWVFCAMRTDLYNRLIAPLYVAADRVVAYRDVAHPLLLDQALDKEMFKAFACSRRGTEESVFTYRPVAGVDDSVMSVEPDYSRPFVSQHAPIIGDYVELPFGMMKAIYDYEARDNCMLEVPEEEANKVTDIVINYSFVWYRKGPNYKLAPVTSQYIKYLVEKKISDDDDFKSIWKLSKLANITLNFPAFTGCSRSIAGQQYFLTTTGSSTYLPNYVQGKEGLRPSIVDQSNPSPISPYIAYVLGPSRAKVIKRTQDLIMAMYALVVVTRQDREGRTTVEVKINDRASPEVPRSTLQLFKRCECLLVDGQTMFTSTLSGQFTTLNVPLCFSDGGVLEPGIIISPRPSRLWASSLMKAAIARDAYH